MCTSLETICFQDCAAFGSTFAGLDKADYMYREDRDHGTLLVFELKAYGVPEFTVTSYAAAE